MTKLRTKAKRVIKAGFVNFWRNGWVSLATVLVMVITLFTVGSLIFSSVILGSLLSQIQDKVDISIYIKPGADENNIFALKDELSKLPEVKNVDYISADQALADFKERHKDNELIIQSLDELNDNPLGAILNVKAKEPSQYETVANFLDSEVQTDNSQSVIDKVNYYQNQKIIERLSKILDSAKKLGAILTILLLVLSVIVTFNTVRLAIYISREEIGVMKLVGASGRFVSGPFIIEGIIYGIVSTVITMILFYPLTLWLGPITESFFTGINLFRYYVSNFGQILLLLILVGTGLGAFSSFIAVRRYLKV